MNTITYSPSTDLSRVGAKSAGLLRLAGHGFNVPRALLLDAPTVQAIMGAAHKRFSPSRDYGHLVQFLRELPPLATVAVRSSGAVSMPGVLETVTSVAATLPAIHKAIIHVAASWFTDRAVNHRKLFGIPEGFNMGIVVQYYIAPRHVQHLSGVLLTRDQNGGGPMVETVPGEGRGLVSGTRAPAIQHSEHLWSHLSDTAERLERIFRRPQEVEFVYDGCHFYLVQVRPQRNLSSSAMLRVASDLHEKGILTITEANQMLSMSGQSKAPWWLRVDVPKANPPITTGLASVAGAVTGRLTLRAPYGPGCIFVADTTEVDDAANMLQCAGILTSVGGVTCHASMLASAAGVPAVVNAGFRITDHGSIVFCVNKHVEVTVSEGHIITIDGTTGAIYRGQQPIIDSRVNS